MRYNLYWHRNAVFPLFIRGNVFYIVFHRLRKKHFECEVTLTDSKVLH